MAKVDSSRHVFMSRVLGFLKENSAPPSEPEEGVALDAFVDSQMKGLCFVVQEHCEAHIHRKRPEGRHVAELLFGCCAPLTWEDLRRSSKRVRQESLQPSKAKGQKWLENFFRGLALEALDVTRLLDPGNAKALQHLSQEEKNHALWCLGEKLQTTVWRDATKDAGLNAIGDRPCLRLLQELTTSIHDIIMIHDKGRKRRRAQTVSLSGNPYSRFWQTLPLGFAGYNFLLLRLMELLLVFQLKTNDAEQRQRLEALRRLAPYLSRKPLGPPQEGSGLLICFRTPASLAGQPLTILAWPVILSVSQKAQLNELDFPMLMLQSSSASTSSVPVVKVPSWLRFDQQELAPAQSQQLEAAVSLHSVCGFGFTPSGSAIPLLYTPEWFGFVVQMILYSPVPVWEALERMAPLRRFVMPATLLDILHAIVGSLTTCPENMEKVLRVFTDHSHNMPDESLANGFMTWAVEFLFALEVATRRKPSPQPTAKEVEKRIQEKCEALAHLPTPVDKLLGLLEASGQQPASFLVQYKLARRVDSELTCLQTANFRPNQTKELDLDSSWQLMQMEGLVEPNCCVAVDFDLVPKYTKRSPVTLEYLIMLYVTAHPKKDPLVFSAEHHLLDKGLRDERTRAAFMLQILLRHAVLPATCSLTPGRLQQGARAFLQRALEVPRDNSWEDWERRLRLFAILFDLKESKGQEMAQYIMTLALLAPDQAACSMDLHLPSPSGSQAPAKGVAIDLRSALIQYLGALFQDADESLFPRQGKDGSQKEAFLQLCAERATDGLELANVKIDPKDPYVGALARSGWERLLSDHAFSKRRMQADQMRSLNLFQVASLPWWEFLLPSPAWTEFGQQLSLHLATIRRDAEPYLERHGSSWELVCSGLDPWWTATVPKDVSVRLDRNALRVALGHLCCAWVFENGCLGDSDVALEDRQRLFSLLRGVGPKCLFPPMKVISDFSEKLLSWTADADAAWQLKQELESESGQALLLVTLAQRGSKNTATYYQHLQKKMERMSAAEWRQVLGSKPFMGLEKLLRAEPAAAKKAATPESRFVEKLSKVVCALDLADG